MAKCIITSREAREVAQGLNSSLDALEIACPDLPKQLDATALQEIFQRITKFHPKAVAYVWDEGPLKPIDTYGNPSLNCRESDTPERCVRLKNAHEGKLSHDRAQAEEAAGNPDLCVKDGGWEAKEKVWDEEWIKYFNDHKHLLYDPLKLSELLEAFPGYEETFGFLPSFDATDARLLGALVLISRFLVQSGFDFKEDADMIEFKCSRRGDCDIVSTAALDWLRQSGIEGLEKIEADVYEDHLTLQVTLNNGLAIYFNNTKRFIWAKNGPYKFKISPDTFHQTIPLWQIEDCVGLSLGSKFIISMEEGRTTRPDDFIKAVEALEKALKINPLNADAHHKLGVVWGEHGDYDRAIEELKKTLTIDPKYATAHYNLGFVLNKKGNKDEAIDEFKKALEFNPTDTRVHYWLGIILSEKGDIEGAIFQFEAALQNDPNYEWVKGPLKTLYEKKFGA